MACDLLSYDILPINIGVGSDISIKSLAEKISEIVGYSETILRDKSKPDSFYMYIQLIY